MLRLHAQAPGTPLLHLRVPARTRLIDDRLLAALVRLRVHAAHGAQGQPQQLEQLACQVADGAASTSGTSGLDVQVVSLGCGMDTRPWRLPLSHPPAGSSHDDAALASHDGSSGSGAAAPRGLPAMRVHWIDVDMPAIAALKRCRLALIQAGMDARASGVSSVTGAEAATGAAVTGPTTTEETAAQAQLPGSAPAFPLRAHSYTLAGADLSQVSLRQVLAEAGFNPALRTVW